MAVLVLRHEEKVYKENLCAINSKYIPHNGLIRVFINFFFISFVLLTKEGLKKDKLFPKRIRR